MKGVAAAFFCIAAGLFAGPLHAHAAEQGFVLLLPTGLYTAGGVAAVALSLVLVALVPGATVKRLFRPYEVGRVWDGRRLRITTSLTATVAFFALIWIGLTGPTSPTSNLLPLTIWTALWVGLVAAQGVVGDVWRWANPWAGLFAVLTPGHAGLLRLPEKLGVWPAVGLLIALNGFALADIAPNDPRRLAGVALGYWLFTFAAMFVFGPRTWLRQGEVFGVFFGLIARLAPVQACEGRLHAGLPGWAALRGQAPDLSRAVFCLALLACGSFDGLHETFWWLTKLGINPLEFPGRSAVFWSSSLGLLAGNAALIAVFAVAVWIGVQLAGPEVPFATAFCALALAILPIAYGYHIAHYLTGFLVQMQYWLLAMNDPLRSGADLLGLAQMRVTTGFLNTQGTVRVLWLTQAGAVVASHVASVLMGHAIAHRLWPRAAQAVRAQLGIGALMIAYTVFGLWLLASPRGM